ncbi:uncharacterized protein LOC141673594 [Apium graveolens]|uniref:uncharacterized protein LOC141673594 n=1 Tax=Apium graveolens TaxID=4045 RepID=UPI003D7A4EEB
MGSKRRVRGRNVENVFKNPSEPENQVCIHGRVAINNKIGHSVTTSQSMTDQSVTPGQGTVSSQFTRLKQQPQSVLKSPLSIFDENISPNISAASKSGPSSFNTANVKSTFEKGESSRQKNLMNDFNDVDDNVTIDSDTTCGDMESDIEDIDKEYLSNNHSMWDRYLDLGAPDKICSKCDVVMWNHKKNNKSSPNKPPTFSLCCKNGQVVLDKEKQPPEPLATLLTDRNNEGCAEFRNIVVQGVNYHNIGSLVPTDDTTPKFCQLYIYDIEEEINNMIHAVNGGKDVVNEEIVQSLLHMLDEHNRLVKGFCMARERVRQNAVNEFKLVLISSSSAGGQPNHIAPSNEVAGLIVTSPYAKGCRDTIIDSRVDGLQRIFETDPCFMQLQYPLFFPHRDIGYYREIPLNRPVKHSKRDVVFTESEDPDEKDAREYITIREFYNYKLMIRLSEGLTPHLGGRLWQQYVVDAFTAIEQYRLDWIRNHQTTIRSDLYHNIRDAMYNSHTFFDECGFPIYKRRRTGITINKKGVNLDNRFVVPFNRDLLVHFQCHMNLEICNNSRSLKYLFKYCLKGHDTATMCLRKTRTCTSATIPKKAPKGLINEVKYYLDGRYVCASEASWRIFAFDIHSRWPSVERLPIHLPGKKHVSFKVGDVLRDVCDNAISKKTKLEAWKKGSRSFEDLKTVNGHIHETFKEACVALGLLQNDNQWHEAIAENFHTSLPPQLRAMFVNILAYNPISDPLRLWEANWQCMSDDILVIRRHMLNDPHLYLSDEDLKNYALAGLYLIIILPE